MAQFLLILPASQTVCSLSVCLSSLPILRRCVMCTKIQSLCQQMSLNDKNRTISWQQNFCTVTHAHAISCTCIVLFIILTYRQSMCQLLVHFSHGVHCEACIPSLMYSVPPLDARNTLKRRPGMLAPYTHTNLLYKSKYIRKLRWKQGIYVHSRNQIRI